MDSKLLQNKPWQGYQSPTIEPQILLAGYWMTILGAENGGVFNMLAAVSSQEPVQKVEIYFQGSPTGIFLLDDGNNGDFSAGDGIFGLQAAIPKTLLADAGLKDTKYNFEIVVTDASGHQSTKWPYLTIKP